MANIVIKTFPQSEYRFRIIDNPQKKSLATLKKELGCYGLVNLGYFRLSDFRVESSTMVAGKWLFGPTAHEHGICIDKDGKLTLGTEKDASYDYTVGLPPTIIDGNVYHKKAADNTDKNGLTWIGIKADGAVVVLVVSRDSPKSSAWAAQTLTEYGCVHCLRYDGSWSSQCDLGDGDIVKPSEKRDVRNLLAIYKRNEEEGKPPVSTKKIVCLDPGHGPGSPKGSPDGTYKEEEFDMDMAKRVAAILKQNGLNVVLTRDAKGYPSLTQRANISNKANADLFVSLHSNAAGGSGWSNARGCEVYTSSPGSTAGRNVAAGKILARLKAAGVLMRPSPLRHEGFTVLTVTKAPAVLIEYGFHDNKEDVALLKSSADRDKLAVATAQGICDYLGVSFKPQATNPDREAVQKRFDLDKDTIDYLEQYKYGADLLRKLATKG